MTLTPFPPLEPIAEESGRELRLGKFPNRRYDARNGGSSTVRGFGSLSIDVSLQISFGVITDQEVADVWLAWDTARGDYGALELPEKFFFGIGPELRTRIQESTEWHFSKTMPNFRAAGPGYSRLDPITFVGELPVQYLSGTWTPLPVGVPNNGSWVGAGDCNTPWTPL